MYSYKIYYNLSVFLRFFQKNPNPNQTKINKINLFYQFDSIYRFGSIFIQTVNTSKYHIK